jgi:hypothetical protein
MLNDAQKELLQKYVPLSGMVEAAFLDMHPELNKDFDRENFDQLIIEMTEKALQGDIQSLMNLLDLTYTNAYNEGMLDEFSAQEALG